MPALRILLTGDLVLDVAEPDHWLSGIAPVLRGADLVVGHLEVPHSRRGAELQGDVPAPGADPDHLAALPRAGFHAVTLAGNHIADCGAEGIADTVDTLRRLGIASCGAGANLALARQPALLERGGRRIALHSFNCVGPDNGWASADRAGCAYLRMATADGGPVTPRAALQSVTDEAIAMLREDLLASRRVADLVIVALHKGIVHTPARLAPYERAVARAAVEAGADVVIGHHAHIVRGIEFVQGRPVFHGLGNGCVVTHALSPGQDHPARAAWVEQRKKLFGFEPDPAYTLAPFHPEAVNAMIGCLDWHADGRLQAGVVPVHVEAPGRPVVADAGRAAQVARYIESITTAAGLPAVQLADCGPVWEVS